MAAHLAGLSPYRRLAEPPGSSLVQQNLAGRGAGPSFSVSSLSVSPLSVSPWLMTLALMELWQRPLAVS